MILDLILIAIIVAQQGFYLWQIQKLLDKAMSRSYTEYTQAKRPPKPRGEAIDSSPDEDLGALQEFSTFQI